jgi:hypothetical protein
MAEVVPVRYVEVESNNVQIRNNRTDYSSPEQTRWDNGAARGCT